MDCFCFWVIIHLCSVAQSALQHLAEQMIQASTHQNPSSCFYQQSHQKHQLASIHAQTITLPPLCLTNNVWYVLDHELFRFHHQLGFHLSKYFFFSRTVQGSFRKSNMIFLLLSVTSSLQYVLSLQYIGSGCLPIRRLVDQSPAPPVPMSKHP